MTKDFSDLFQNWLADYFQSSLKKKDFVELLFASQEYSLKTGGKRFRPFLSTLVFQIWQKDLSLLKNFCLAIEMIHTYSLIHDDLPCMDNDDLRRGQPTNHKVFGEDIALLAGDGLLTEAFHLISTEKKLQAEVRLRMVEIVSEKIGSFGMVGGQVLDMKSTKTISIAQIQQIHQMKTGCLIEAAAVGAAVAAEATESEISAVSDYAKHLGIAFQIKDDLLDLQDNQQDFKNYVSVLGHKSTLHHLNEHSEKAIECLNSFDSHSRAVQSLKDLIRNNQQRNV